MARIALVTGGTRGIGAAIAVALKEDGYQVAATYHSNDEAAQKFQNETGVNVYKWDVGSIEECSQGVEKITAELGNIEILVNNAGITRDGFFHKLALDKWDAVIQTNLTSAFNMTKAVINSMRDNSFGRIINISSINGLKGQAGQVNYSAAKAGIIGFTKALALETVSKGITVNAIAPGYVATEMVKAIREDILEKIVAGIPVGRLAEPSEIARVVGFLAADEAGFITGETISINGGQYMS